MDSDVEHKAEREFWQVDDLTIDVGSQRVLRGKDEVVLPQLSFRFLLALVRAAPDVKSIDELIDEVWRGIVVNAETVTQRAKLLRDSLGDDPRNPRYFTARRSAGYQLLPVPQAVSQVEASGTAPAAQHVAGARFRFPPLAIAVALALGLIAAVGATWLWQARTEATTQAQLRVAVLPFENLSSDPADAFIARGIPEMVLNRLSSVPGLAVISQESALLAGSGSQDGISGLNVDFVVQGSVQRVGDALRVTCFILETSTREHLWSESFDWPFDRLYELQDQIAARVANTLASRMERQVPVAEPTSATDNVDAYLAYLQGKALIGRFTVAQTGMAAVQFERAVRMDPDFAPALVALYDARMQSADLRKEDLAAARRQFGPLLDRALRINPRSGEALFARAMWSDLPREDRIALFREASRLDPSNSRGLAAFAEFLEWENTTRDNPYREEGQALMQRVLSIDPLGTRARFWSVQRQLGRLTPDQLELEQQRALELDPNNYLLANRYAMRRWRMHGAAAEALGLMEQVVAADPQNPWGAHIETAIYLDVGEPQAARAVAATTPGSRDSTRALLALYDGRTREAGEAAIGPRGFLFNQFENYLWSEAIRDRALQTHEFRPAIQAISGTYGFSLENPRVSNLQQTAAAVPLAHLLIASGEQQLGSRLLAQTVQWINEHQLLGLQGGTGSTKARALMLLGQRDEALSTLAATVESAMDCRHWWYFARMEPVWAPVRADPRFVATMETCRRRMASERDQIRRMREQGVLQVREARSG